MRILKSIHVRIQRGREMGIEMETPMEIEIEMRILNLSATTASNARPNRPLSVTINLSISRSVFRCLFVSAHCLNCDSKSPTAKWISFASSFSSYYTLAPKRFLLRSFWQEVLGKNANLQLLLMRSLVIPCRATSIICEPFLRRLSPPDYPFETHRLLDDVLDAVLPHIKLRSGIFEFSRKKLILLINEGDKFGSENYKKKNRVIAKNWLSGAQPQNSIRISVTKN